MRSIWRNAALLALVETIAACAGGLGKGHAIGTEVVAATTGAPVSREAAQSMTPAAANKQEKRVMDEDAPVTFEVFRRGGRYYVAAVMQGASIGSATSTDVIPTEPVVDSIAAAFRYLKPRIREEYAVAQRGERRDNKNWERMGAKNSRQFVRSTSICSVHLGSDPIEIWYMIPDAKGYMFRSHGDEPDARFSPDASYEDIARAILEVFAKNPPPPGDKPTAAPKRPRKSAATE